MTLKHHRHISPSSSRLLSQHPYVSQRIQNQLYANSRLFRNFQLFFILFLFVSVRRRPENILFTFHDTIIIDSSARCESTTVAQWSMISGFVCRDGMGRKIIKRQPHESLRRQMSVERAENLCAGCWRRADICGLSGAIGRCWMAPQTSLQHATYIVRGKSGNFSREPTFMRRF